MHGGRYMWLNNDEIRLLDSIFEAENIIPKNRKVIQAVTLPM